MEKGNWSLIKERLKSDIVEIFNDYDLESLNDYEKRKIIFDYLCKNVSYDFELLGDIKEFIINKKAVTRDSFLELESVINKKIGICNGIAQYYKLLLEEVGINAFCVICDDGTVVKHQLCLVYDAESDIYSFDDVTSVIVGRGNDEYFDYDLKTANALNQGLKEVFGEKKWFILPDSYINFLVGRDNNSAINLDELPDNISSVKSNIEVGISI